VFSPFDGNVELVEVNVKVGDTVTLGQARERRPMPAAR
jgi:hypothetical protein